MRFYLKMLSLCEIAYQCIDRNDVYDCHLTKYWQFFNLYNFSLAINNQYARVLYKSTLFFLRELNNLGAHLYIFGGTPLELFPQT